MRHWNTTLFGFALLGLVLLITANILLMCAPSYPCEKLSVFIGGLLISIMAMILQVRVWRRCQGDQEDEADWK